MTEEDIKDLLSILEKDAKELIKEAEPFVNEINNTELENGGNK